jgi:uncharacterized phiE125 gp8 family phage protein
MTIQFAGGATLDDFLTVDELQEWLRVDSEDDASVIGDIRNQALAWVEWYCRLPIGVQNVTVYLDNWDAVQLRLRYAKTITDVAYIAVGESTYTTLSTDNWRADLASQRPRISFVSPPAYATDQYNPVRVTMTAGCTSAEFPAALKGAAKNYAAHIYENREAVGAGNLKETPMGLLYQVSQFRTI